MERRWTTRTRLCVDVDIAHDSGSVRCTTQDIGLGGLYVALPRTSLSEGQNVEVTFYLTQLATAEEHKLRARVVRTPPGGAGLMFRDFDASAFRSLQRVMRVRESAVL